MIGQKPPPELCTAAAQRWRHQDIRPIAKYLPQRRSAVNLPHPFPIARAPSPTLPEVCCSLETIIVLRRATVRNQITSPRSSEADHICGNGQWYTGSNVDTGLLGSMPRGGNSSIAPHRARRARTVVSHDGELQLLYFEQQYKLT